MPLNIIGTSHIARQSIKEIRQAIIASPPDIVAVELDARRLHALIHKKKAKVSVSSIPVIGFKGYVFALIGSFIQRKLGKIVNLEPGSDMLEAVKYAFANKKKIVLIDRDIQITLKRFSASLTWREKMHFITDIMKGIFFPGRELEKYNLQELDLRKVPSDKMVANLTKEMKKRYPNVYKVLVEERNDYMAEKLNMLLKKHPELNILAVVGAGHKEEIQKAVNI